MKSVAARMWAGFWLISLVGNFLNNLQRHWHHNTEVKTAPSTSDSIPSFPRGSHQPRECSLQPWDEAANWPILNFVHCAICNITGSSLNLEWTFRHLSTNSFSDFITGQVLKKKSKLCLVSCSALSQDTPRYCQIDRPFTVHLWRIPIPEIVKGCKNLHWRVKIG